MSMDAAVAAVSTRWARIARGPAASAWLDVLLRAYSEDHRAYHTLPHIASMLAHLDAFPGLRTARADAAACAALFHDAVYDPASRTNEEDSAALVSAAAPAVLPAWAEVPPQWVQVAVLATKHHRLDPPPLAESSPAACDAVARLPPALRPAGAPASALASTAAVAGWGREDVAALACVLDADLAVLGADWRAYAAYAAGVRREYAAHADGAFCAGRSAFLAGLAGGLDPVVSALGAPAPAAREERVPGGGLVRDRVPAHRSLFHTVHAYDRWEAAARSNLARERELLALGAAGLQQVRDEGGDGDV
jgi:predicted metal-dependent HD superfamily phosphohydrolase